MRRVSQDSSASAHGADVVPVISSSIIVSSVINIVLDLVFVAVLRLGIAGAAYATIIAQAVSTIEPLVDIRKE